MENARLFKIYETANILKNVECNIQSVVDKDYSKVKSFMVEVNHIFQDQFECLSSMMLKKVV